jgi:hypothetical protein
LPQNTELKFDLVSPVDELAKQIRMEFDFKHEAHVMDAVRETLQVGTTHCYARSHHSAFSVVGPSSGSLSQLQWWSDAAFLDCRSPRQQIVWRVYLTGRKGKPTIICANDFLQKMIFAHDSRLL